MRPLSPERFDEIVADALDRIPDWIAEQMDNVAVFATDWPSPDQDPDGDTLLGLYEGVDLTERSPLAYDGAMPDRITLFRGPLTRISRDEHDLRRNIEVTVVHEIGHHFGIDDERLHELGWA